MRGEGLEFSIRDMGHVCRTEHVSALDQREAVKGNSGGSTPQPCCEPRYSPPFERRAGVPSWWATPRNIHPCRPPVLPPPETL